MNKNTLYDGSHSLTFQDLWLKSPEDMTIFERRCQAEGLYYESHLLIVQYLLEMGIDAIVDIGCGSGTQGYLFRAAGIRYIVVARYEKNLRFGEIHFPDNSLVIKHSCWPCDIPEAKGITTCISAYALGIHGEEHLASATLRAMKKRFERAYILAFPHAQAFARHIWGSTSQWIRPYEPGDQWVQICERPTQFHLVHAAAKRMTSILLAFSSLCKSQNPGQSICIEKI